MSRVADHYDSLYRRTDAFQQDRRLYKWFVSALVRKIGLPVGSRILDAGCGQGYLSKYLADMGMDVSCSDISIRALQSLERYGATFHGKRVMADMLQPPFLGAFDLAFQRSCSLWNSHSARLHREMVERLTDCVRVGGIICVVYNSNLRTSGDHWLNHTPEVIARAFVTPRIRDVDGYVVNKIDSILLGRHGFSRPVTLANVILAKMFCRSLEVCVFARREV